MEERQWLLSSAYNTGIECLQFVVNILTFFILLTSAYSACSLDEARRWFEASTVVCRFVPDGKSRSEKVRANSHFSTLIFPQHLENRYPKPTHTCSLGTKLVVMTRQPYSSCS